MSGTEKSRMLFQMLPSVMSRVFFCCGCAGAAIVSPPSKMQEFHRYFTINLTIHRSVPNVKQNEKERPQTFHILFADCSKLTQRNSIFIRYNKGAVGKTRTRSPISGF